MLPLSSENFEQDSDYALHIRLVQLINLGVYTCQAYNGIDKAASWEVTLLAVGPISNVRPEHKNFTQYLLPTPTRPAPTEKPQYPYRPQRPEYSSTRSPNPVKGQIYSRRPPTIAPLPRYSTRPELKGEKTFGTTISCFTYNIA